MTKEIFLNITKVICDKAIANTRLNEQNPNTFPLKLGTRQRCSLLLVFQYKILQVLSRNIREMSKGKHTGKKKPKSREPYF